MGFKRNLNRMTEIWGMLFYEYQVISNITEVILDHYPDTLSLHIFSWWNTQSLRRRAGIMFPCKSSINLINPFFNLYSQPHVGLLSFLWRNRRLINSTIFWNHKMIMTHININWSWSPSAWKLTPRSHAGFIKAYILSYCHGNWYEGA